MVSLVLLFLSSRDVSGLLVYPWSFRKEVFVKAANPRTDSVMGPRVLAGVKEALRDTEQQAPHVPSDCDFCAGKGSQKTSTGGEPGPRALCSWPGGSCSQQRSVKLTDSLVPVPRGPSSLTHLSVRLFVLPHSSLSWERCSVPSLGHPLNQNPFVKPFSRMCLCLALYGCISDLGLLFC